MDLEPTINPLQDENIYSDYDDRPIRPMDQDALNEALARLPILIDEDDPTAPSDANTSLKTRRQPILAYSTRRKHLSGVTITQAMTHPTPMNGTPMSNKRKIIGGTPIVTPIARKFVKHADCQQELLQLREEKLMLEESKANLQLECLLMKKSYETELETLKHEQQRSAETLQAEHQLQCDQYHASLIGQEQLLNQATLELDTLRNDHNLLLLEKATLDTVVVEYGLLKETMNHKLLEYELMIKNLREELQQQQQQQKQVVSRSVLGNDRMALKETAPDRARNAKNTSLINESIRSKVNNKTQPTRGPKKDELIKTPSLSIHASMNKSNSSICSSTSTIKLSSSKSKVKPALLLDEKKKSTSSVPSTSKPPHLIATRTKSKVVPKK